MIEILFKDGDLIAVNKPPGISVHEAPGPGSSVMRQLRTQGLADLTPVHRLDKDASGVLLLAKTKATASALQKKWETVEKTYWALCAGAPPESNGLIDAPILENQSGKPERLERALKYFRKIHGDKEPPPLPKPKTSAVHPAGRKSQTAYRVLQTFERDGKKWSWLEVRPLQGRMHQIRVHLAHAAAPLALDTLYGPPGAELKLKRLPLHAAALTIEWPVDSGKRMTISAPLPADIKVALETLRKGA